jgi:hypothetical protein
MVTRKNLAGVYGHADNSTGVEGSTLRSDTNGGGIVGICRRPNYTVNLNPSSHHERNQIPGLLRLTPGGFPV